MSCRFFIDSPVTGDRALLDGPEARHLIQVMRARVGDTLILFDGSGAEFDARVTAVDRGSVQLEVLAGREVNRERAVKITLAVALPKGERQRWLVEKSVEIGVARLVPLVTERGVARPVQRVISRLQRHVIEASKQCGRNRLMEITTPKSSLDYFAQPPDGALRILAHTAESGRGLLGLATASSASQVILAVGPEGGFSEAELAAASQWHTVRLGPRTLRVETAALVLAACFSLLDQ